ncbi:hypothetical protein [Photobacterium damselae]|uniref:hypothetical protein n=1 Tax=Photobacterium damselae TaxID=38293 RepID=UPI001F1888E4|nr:hypothetical protein [Photobacterium damselae]UKA04450.1 hypothetical protein IHC89_22775 [Photobacterium damselae subsp. damselae]
MEQLVKDVCKSQSLMNNDLMKGGRKFSKSVFYEIKDVLAMCWKTTRGAENYINKRTVDMKKNGIDIDFVPSVVQIELMDEKRFVLREYQYVLGDCHLRCSMDGVWCCQLLDRAGNPVALNGVKTFKSEDEARACANGWSYDVYLSELQMESDAIAAKLKEDADIADEKAERANFERTLFEGMTIDELLNIAIDNAKKSGDCVLQRQVRMKIWDAEDQAKEALEFGDINRMDNEVFDFFPDAFNALKKHLTN